MIKRFLIILFYCALIAVGGYLIEPANATPKTNTSSKAIAASVAKSNAHSKSTSKSNSHSSSKNNNKVSVVLGQQTESGDANSKSASNAKGGNSKSQANGKQSVNIVQKQSEIPPPTASATPGTVNHRGCRYGVGAGGQNSAFGISLSGSFEDPNCEARLNAETFSAMGHPDMALLSMCFIPESRKMLEAIKKVDCSFVDNVRSVNFDVDNSN